jgi:spore maturation protein CgeB
MVDRMFSEKPDLIIWRYPLCLTDENREYIKEKSLGITNIAWCSEQGPMNEIEMKACRGFDTIAVNNKMDRSYYENRTDAKIIIVPWSCLPQLHKKVQPVDKYVCDIVSDGSPHYHITDFNILLPIDKRISCDVVVVPISKLNYKYKVYGNYEIYHGWKFVPIPKSCYGGEYPILDAPSVYGSAKLYAGITWNHRYGGFGSKLAKAMGCGIPVLWQKTTGMEEEGLFDMKNIIVTESPRETIEKVEWIMENDREREQIAIEGQKYAYNYCDWVKNVQKLLDEAEGGMYE